MPKWQYALFLVNKSKKKWSDPCLYLDSLNNKNIPFSGELRHLIDNRTSVQELSVLLCLHMCGQSGYIKVPAKAIVFSLRRPPTYSAWHSQIVPHQVLAMINRA